MLSLGTEDFFAFWIASYSVGLPARSPPPIRAATSMFLISLANIFPRRASMTAFLCLVVAHLEWPDISVPFRGHRRKFFRVSVFQVRASQGGVAKSHRASSKRCQR